MSVSNKPGMIKTPNLGLNVGTSRGFMDNKSAGENAYTMDQIAGALHDRRFILKLDPTVDIPAVDTWTFISMPSNIASQIGLGPYDHVFRFSNIVKLLCARVRALVNVAGAAHGVVSFMLRKGGTGAGSDKDLLVNPMTIDDQVTDLQNVSGVGKSSPETPLVGMDQDAILLFVKKDANVAATDISVEIIIAAQMVPGTPSNFTET